MRVLSFEDLNSGRAPKISSFRLVVDRIKERLNCESVYGGIVLGSTICREPRRTSDVDVIVVPQSKQVEPACSLICRGIGEYATSLHVPVFFMIMPLEDLKIGEHTITRPFYLHLKAAALRGGVFGENPLPCVSLDLQSPIVTAVRQTILKKRDCIMNWKTKSSASISPEERAQFCGYVLSIAPSICLNMLYVDNPDFTDSGQDIYSEYKDVFKSPTTRDALNLLIKWRDRYDEVVAMSQTPVEEWPPHRYLTEWNKGAHLSFLESMEGAISPFAMAFLERNLEYLRET